MYETDACIKCGKILRDYDDYPPISIPGKGEMCADCYNQISHQESYSYFMGV